MRKLSHPNIIKLCDFYDQSDRYLLVMDLAPGKDLYERVRVQPYAEEEARILFQNIIETVKYLHSMNVVHRDIKLENILMKSDGSRTDIFLADFGFATECTADELDECVGTPQYAGKLLYRDRTTLSLIFA